MKTYLMTADGIKGIPLQSYPPEAWRTITGGESGTGSIASYYETVPWLFRGVEARVNALVGLPFAIHRGDEDGAEVDEEMLGFSQPLTVILDMAYRWFILYGATYGLRVQNRVRTLDFRPLHPASMTPVTDATDGLTGFRRSVGGVVIDLQLDEVWYWWRASHTSEVGPGLSDAARAAIAAGILHNLGSYGSAYFAQGTIMPTVMMLPESTQPADVQRVESWAKRMLTGVRNAFGIQAVAGKVETVTLGQGMSELAVPELTNTQREDIATALGVPQTLMFSNAANYATAAQDDLHFYSKTILPDAIRMAETLNRQVFARQGLMLVWHPERMEIFQAAEQEKAYRLVSLVGGPVMTVNEARATMGLDPMPEAETNELVDVTPDDETSDAKPSGQAAEDMRNEMQADEMRRWRAMAVKRFKEGKPAKAAQFETSILPRTRVAAIRGQLEACQTPAMVGLVFDAAREWVAYP